VNTQPLQVLVVVPAWNESATVAAVVAEVRRHGHDILVVDDGSSDDSARVAEEAGATTVRLPLNLGVGAALRCGFHFAIEHGYDAVVQVDADGQHPVHAVDALVREATTTGAHLVIGSRFAAEAAGMRVGRLRRAVMAGMARAASRATGSKITDSTSGFRVIREPLLSEFARTFPSHYLGDTYEAVISAGRAGYTVREIPVAMSDRAHGQSSASPLAAVRLTFRALLVVATKLHFPVRPIDCTQGRRGGMRARRVLARPEPGFGPEERC
jgi:glycosyltransferase involved in cell wall biosynthesis